MIDFKIVASESMSPTLRKRELVAISKLGYNIFGIEYNDPEVKDIIAFKHENDLLIKRISNFNDSKDLYLLGDNSLNSFDSREFGYIKSDSIVGKAIFKFDFNEFTITFLNR